MITSRGVRGGRDVRTGRSGRNGSRAGDVRGVGGVGDVRCGWNVRSVRGGVLGGAVGLAAAATGAVLVADRRVARTRRTGRAGVCAYADTFDSCAHVRTDDGVTLAVYSAGLASAPVTVVGVHGFCLDHRSFSPLAAGLRERFGDGVRVVTYDQRSHGRSGRSPRAGATVDRLGHDLANVLDRVVPEGPVVLVGHSMGGMAVLALVQQRSELVGPAGRVRGVLLADTSTGRLATITLGFPAALTRVGVPLLPALLYGARRGRRVVERGRARLDDVAWVFVRRLSFGPGAPPELVEFVADAIAATPIDVIADFAPTLTAHDKLAALERLAGTPLTVLCGAEDVITPPGHSRVIADAVAGSRLVIVPAAGHLALLERPDLVDEAVAELVTAALAPRRRRRVGATV